MTESSGTVLIDSLERLREYLNAENNDRCLEYDSNGSFEDAVILKLISSMIGNENPQQLQSTEKCVRDEILRELKRSGISIRQISRLTGINRNIIQRA